MKLKPFIFVSFTPLLTLVSLLNLPMLTKSFRLLPPTRYISTLSTLSSSSFRLFSSSSSTATSSTSSINDTIFALSTPQPPPGAASALAIIRISGPLSLPLLQKLTPATKQPSRYEPRKAYVRKLINPTSPSPLIVPHQSQHVDVLDEAIVIFFASPSSSTGEDVLELHLHGSSAVVHGVLSCLSSISAAKLLSPTLVLRPADKGEFTQKAYNSGKLSILQIEGLADLLNSQTSAQRRLALSHMTPKVNELYDEWRDVLVSALAHAEAVIDFGDDEEQGVGDEVWGDLVPKIECVVSEMNAHLGLVISADGETTSMNDTFLRSKGELVTDGINISIIGPTNAGKSSLINVLAEREVAIVSNEAGTTRDVINVDLDLGGYKVKVYDTAGFRDVDDCGVGRVEAEGMKRAKSVARRSEIVVCLIDAMDVGGSLKSVEDVFGGGDGDAGRGAAVVYVINKIDLIPCDLQKQFLSTLNLPSEPLLISCSTNDGIASFLTTLTTLVKIRVENSTAVEREGSSSSSSKQDIMITRLRHRRHLTLSSEALKRFLILATPIDIYIDNDNATATATSSSSSFNTGDNLMSIDVAAEELRMGVTELGRIVGGVDVEDVLDVLFRDFCIGK